MANPVLTHVKFLHNKPLLSDFTLVDDAGSKLHLHKLILYSSPYFQHFFESGVTTDKSQTKVHSVEVARLLTSYLYTGVFTVPPSITASEFIDLCDLTEMWCLSSDIKLYLFTHLYHNWMKILEEDLRYADILFRHFGQHPRVQIDKIICEGTSLISWIVTYLVEHNEEIPLEMTEGTLFKNHFPRQVVTEVLIRLGAYEKVSLNSLSNLKTYIKKYYNPKTKVFTPKQLSALKTYKFIGNGDFTGRDDNGDIMNRTLVVKSLKPFQGTMYHYLGDVEGKSKQHHAIFVTLVRDFQSSRLPSGVYDKKLFIAGQTYDIISIHLDDEEATEFFSGNEYSFSLRLNSSTKMELPNNSSEVYWIESL